jgi:two-component system, OmpR family, manganese sensing response regulator
MHILLVDDELELLTPLSRILQREGYRVDTAQDGGQGCQLAQQGAYDLLILDWMLPQISGLDLCQQLRSQGITTPVLFLTAKDTLDDRVQGLDAGADDYLVKPFELRELLARVRALLRRPPVAPLPLQEASVGDGQKENGQKEDEQKRTLRVEGATSVTLDLANQRVQRGDRMIELSEKEAQLLAYLMQHPDQLLTHEQIHQHLWGLDAQPTSNALAAQIRLLRRKLEAPGDPPLIHTVYGRGYRFGPTDPSNP